MEANSKIRQSRTGLIDPDFHRDRAARRRALVLRQMFRRYFAVARRAAYSPAAATGALSLSNKGASGLFRVSP